jgi:hypothetical protein
LKIFTNCFKWKPSLSLHSHFFFAVAEASCFWLWFLFPSFFVFVLALVLALPQLFSTYFLFYYFCSLAICWCSKLKLAEQNQGINFPLVSLGNVVTLACKWAKNQISARLSVCLFVILFVFLFFDLLWKGIIKLSCSIFHTYSYKVFAIRLLSQKKDKKNE